MSLISVITIFINMMDSEPDDWREEIHDEIRPSQMEFIAMKKLAEFLKGILLCKEKLF